MIIMGLEVLVLLGVNPIDRRNLYNFTFPNWRLKYLPLGLKELFFTPILLVKFKSFEKVSICSTSLEVKLRCLPSFERFPSVVIKPITYARSAVHFT